MMVGPIGVSIMIERTIPRKEARTEMIAEAMVTSLKLLNSLIAERAGKTIKAETNNDPTNFMAMTTTIAISAAKAKLKTKVPFSVALTKFSSKVTANMRW